MIRQFKDGMGVPHLFQSDLRKFRVIVPPIDEQRSIAEFLDREITMLDHLIDQKRRLRELIEHSRRAVIAAAVTRGVRDVPLKSSGIEWFGDIPRHWTINRLGRLSEEINDINHEMPVAVAGGIPFLSAKDLKDDGSLNFTEDVKLISREDLSDSPRKIVPKRDDIVYSRYGACLGKARLVETDLEFLVSYSCVIIRLRKEIADPKFFTYLLDSDLVLNEARFRTQGIAVPDLGNKMIAKFAVPVPPIEEQQEIAARLDKEVLELRRTSDTIRLGIERLREFRAALISAAVTGQIDVRNYRPQEAAAACHRSQRESLRVRDRAPPGQRAGYTKAEQGHFHQERAIDPTQFIPFLKDTQKKTWERLEKLLAERTEETVLDDLTKAMDSRGSLDVLRHGFKCYGEAVKAAYFKPATRMNPDDLALYQENRLTVVRQLLFKATSSQALDLTLCLNGIPVVTAELKNPMTGQNVQNAMYQYRNDRDPND